MVNRKQLFPESVVGIQFLGSRYFGDDELDYYAWIGNNKGETQFEQDDLNSKSFGARLKYSIDYLDKFDLGFSSYIGELKTSQFHMTNEIIYKVQSMFLSEKNLKYSNAEDINLV